METVTHLCVTPDMKKEANLRRRLRRLQKNRIDFGDSVNYAREENG